VINRPDHLPEIHIDSVAGSRFNAPTADVDVQWMAGDVLHWFSICTSFRTALLKYLQRGDKQQKFI